MDAHRADDADDEMDLLLELYSAYGRTVYVTAVTLVALVGVPYLLFRLAKYGLLRTARGARVVVKRLQLESKDGHILDLAPAYVEKSARERGERVTSLSSYLSSLDVFHSNDAETAKRIVLTLANTLSLSENMMMPLALLPASIPAAIAAKNPGFFARFALSDFPSVLVCAAVVDGVTSLSRQTLDPEKNLKVIVPVDSIDIHMNGEPLNTEPKIVNPPAELSRRRNLDSHLRDENGMRILRESAGEAFVRDMDKLHYACPRPIAQDILPGLCVGHGGLTHTCTPYETIRNRAFSRIMNRLSANLFFWLEGNEEVQKGLLYSCATKERFSPYHLSLVENDDETRLDVSDQLPGHFIKELMRIGGGQIRAKFRSNLTSFGIALCVLDDPSLLPPLERGAATTTTTTDARVREAYTHIPLAFCSRTGVTDALTGDSVKQLSVHCGVEIEIVDNALIGKGTVNFAFYTGIEGFTGFYPGGEWVRPWVLAGQSERPIEGGVEAAARVLDLCAAASISSNACVRRWQFPFGGYGGLGVCADSVALIEQAFTGRTEIFPLMMRGDAKSALLAVITRDLLASLPPAKRSRERAMFELLIKSLILLPNDIQVEPHNILDAIDRIYATTSASPFYCDRFERARLPKIKEDWELVLRRYVAQFAEVNDPSFKNRNMSEKWRLQSSSR